MHHNNKKAATGSARLQTIAAIALSTTMLAGAPSPALAQSATTTLDTITVQGARQQTAQPAAPAAPATGPVEPPPGPAPETAWGPVDGYLATRSATGIKTDTPLREIPQSVSVVGKEQIRDQGAQTLQDTLRYTSGVVADGYGIDSRTDFIFVRGTEATEYLDGLRRTFNYYIYNYRIDPYFMERIEVLKGPASVLYGQAAVGGIVNSVSKRPQKEQYGEITVEYGSFDFKQTRFDFTGAATEDRRWSYRLTGLARDADTQVNYVPDDRLALQPALMFEPTIDTSITLLGHFRRDQTGSTQQFLPHVGTIFPNVSGNFIPWDTFVGEPSDRYDTDAASGTLIVKHDFNDAVTLRHSSRYSDISNEYYSTYPGFFAGNVFGNPNFPYLTPQQDTINRVKSVSLADTQIFNTDTNLEVNFNTGIVSHKVLGGFDYSKFQAESAFGNALNVTPFNLYDPQYGLPETLFAASCAGGAPGPVTEVPVCESPDQDLWQAGFYVQDQIRLGNWIAVLGARHDRVNNSTTGTPTQKDQANTYRAGLMYELAFGLTPYVSYAESFVPVVGTTFAGDPFDPQEGVMYEAGFKYEPVGANFAINSAIFDITESNRLSPDPANPFFSIQSGEVGIQGFEIEAIGQVTRRLTITGAYTFLDAKYTGGAQKGFRVASVPEHLASFWAIHDFSMFGREGFSVGAGVRFVGESWDGTDILVTPSYTLFDAMLAWENEDWRLQITATNLEDEEYLTTCLTRGDCFRGTSRTVIAGVTRKF